MDLQELIDKPLEVTPENTPCWERLLADVLAWPAEIDPDDTVEHGERFEVD